nr:OsmC family protein [Candidatus Njordarchaeum guaymaensis]
MMKISLIENVKFEAECRGHRIVLDQPVDDGGSDAGMTPIELFVASLGSCIAYYAVVFCQRHKIPSDGLNVELGWEWAEDPHRVGAIDVKITLRMKLGEKEKTGLLRMVKGCTVHNTMCNLPEIAFTIN